MGHSQVQKDYEVQIKNYETLCDDQVGKIVPPSTHPLSRHLIAGTFRLALLMDELQMVRRLCTPQHV